MRVLLESFRSARTHRLWLVMTGRAQAHLFLCSHTCTLRSLEVTGARNVSVKIAMLPESDPFEFIVSRGVRPFMAVVDSALNPIYFRIRRVMDDPMPGEQVARLIKLFEIVGEVEFETEKAG